MPRILAVLLLCSSVALAAAAAAAPPAAPSPSPSAAPISAAAPATVLIYPFDVQSGVDPKIGIAIAEILAQEMHAAGGLNVLAVPQNVKRADFLQYARSQKADFYIGGYVTPVGDAAAVVEQVVGVDSGVILFSQTAQVQSVADVASQSLQARAQILAFVNRTTENIATPASSTPSPSASHGAQMQIRGLSSIVDSVFHHRTGETPGPAASPDKPSRGVIVAPVTAPDSPASSPELHNATDELFFALQRHYRVTLTTTTDVAVAADAICGTNRDNTIAAGTLASTAQARERTAWVFTLSVYTCFGAVLGRSVGKGATFKEAVDSAVAAYASAHPQNN